MDVESGTKGEGEEQLDFEPQQQETEETAQQEEKSGEDEADKETTGEGAEMVVEKRKGTAPMKKLSCAQCEFLKFKNIDEWKNHCIGHWRLTGMKSNFQVECFSSDCDFSPTDADIQEKLSKLGQHFIDDHGFEQTAFRKCDICNLEFMEERKYNTHMRKHDESFTCDLCHKKITGKFWYRKHIEKCVGDDRPSWARKSSDVKPGQEKEVLEIYGKEYDVHWGTCTNTFTKESRIVARAWIEGKGWAGKGATKDEARSKLIKYLKDHVKKSMDKGLYTLEDGELVPEPTLSETKAKGGKVSCSVCGTQFSKKANLELHMFMHRGNAAK